MNKYILSTLPMLLVCLVIVLKAILCLGMHDLDFVRIEFTKLVNETRYEGKILLFRGSELILTMDFLGGSGEALISLRSLDGAIHLHRKVLFIRGINTSPYVRIFIESDGIYDLTIKFRRLSSSTSAVCLKLSVLERARYAYAIKFVEVTIINACILIVLSRVLSSRNAFAYLFITDPILVSSTCLACFSISLLGITMYSSVMYRFDQPLDVRNDPTLPLILSVSISMPSTIYVAIVRESGEHLLLLSASHRKYLKDLTFTMLLYTWNALCIAMTLLGFYVAVGPQYLTNIQLLLDLATCFASYTLILSLSLIPPVIALFSRSWLAILAGIGIPMLFSPRLPTYSVLDIPTLCIALSIVFAIVLPLSILAIHKHIEYRC